MSAPALGPRPNTRLSTLLNLAWPVVVSRSSQVVVGLTDALMVTHLGEDALAATTTGAFNTIAVFILPVGIAYLVASFASQLTGKGDPAGARRYGTYGLLLAGATQLLSLLALPLLGPVLGLLPYTPAVRGLIENYLLIRLTSTGAAVGIEALANYYGGIGNTRLPMVVNVIAMVLNVFGNWVLINGTLGVPAMGVAGAALASTLATWIAFLLFWAVFHWGGRDVQRTPSRAAEFWRMLKFGLPSGFNWFFEFFAFNMFVNLVVAGLGTTALASLMAVMQINTVAFMPSFAVASAGAILVGQAIGAQAKDDVPRIVRLTLSTAATWQGLVGLLYLVAPALLFAPFVRGAAESPALMAAGVRLLMLSSAWQLFDAAAGTFAESLRAAGDTTFTMWARIVIAWLIFMPGSYLSVRHLGWGDVGAVSWVVLYLALLAGTLWLRFRAGVWRRIDLTAVEAPLV